MKHLILLLTLFTSLLSVAQESDVFEREFPKSVLDIGIGAGPNYGLLGFKGVIGSQGSGFMVGIGQIEELRTWQLGAQVAYKCLFANVGVGTTAVYTLNEITETFIGTSVMVGVRFNFTKARRVFLELGGGYSETKPAIPVTIRDISPAFVIGLNVRLGGASVVEKK